MEEEKNEQIVEIQKEDEKQYEEVEKAKVVERTDSYFDGKVLELIGYRILAFLITTFTLGLASAWADKILIAYSIEHTVYNGKRLKFEGTGASLFVQKFKWIFLTIITLGIYGFWVPLKKEKWIVSNIHFEKEEFIKEDSYFTGGVLGLIGINLFCKILTTISFGLLFPFVICYKQKWLAKHTVINRKKIVFTGKALSLIGHYLLWWLLCIVTFGIYLLWLPIKIENWKAKNTHIKLKDEEEPKTSVIPAVIGIILAVVLIIGMTCVVTSNVKRLEAEERNFSIESIFDEFKLFSKGESRNSSNGSKSYISTASMNNDNSNNDTNESENKEEIKNEKVYTAKDFSRKKKVTLIDSVACYGSPDHTSDLVASIESGNNIAITESMGAVLIKGTNAKYLYKVSKSKATSVDLYYITKNNDLYVIKNPNSSSEDQKKTKVLSGVVEFLGTTKKNGGKYLRVLLTDNTEKEILYYK